MNVSIVITTLRRPPLLARVVRTIEALGESGFEVFVVCDGEDASTRALADSLQVGFPLRWLFNPETIGLAGSRNAGARNASGELLLFLDDDCIPQPGWLRYHRDLHMNAQCVVAGRIIDTYDREPLSRLEGMLRTSAQADIDSDAALLGTPRESDSSHCVGPNTSVLRSTFLRAGGFDPRLGRGASGGCTAEEDTEFGLRLYATGERFVYEPRAVVHHVMTKDPIAHLLDGAAVLAKCDLYRVREKGQRVPIMFSMYNGRRLRRWRERMAWHLPRLTHAVAVLCSRWVELTGSRVAFYAWQRLAYSWRYWRALRELGVSLAELRAMTTGRALHAAGGVPVRDLRGDAFR